MDLGKSDQFKPKNEKLPSCMTFAQAGFEANYLKICAFMRSKTLSSRLCQKVFFSRINTQKHADHIQILPTLDRFSSVSGETYEFWHKRLDRVFKLQNE